MVRRHWLAAACGQRHQATPGRHRPGGRTLPWKNSESPKAHEQDNPHAAAIYRSIGVYLRPHSTSTTCTTAAMLLLGRVMSGKGGDIISDTCKKVLADEYPELAGKITPELPDEKFRRVGQSMAAARFARDRINRPPPHPACGPKGAGVND